MFILLTQPLVLMKDQDKLRSLLGASGGLQTLMEHSWGQVLSWVSPTPGLRVGTSQHTFVPRAVPKYSKDNCRQHDRRMICDSSCVWESGWEMYLDTKMLKYKEHFCGWWEKLETHLTLRLSWKTWDTWLPENRPFQLAFFFFFSF